MITLLSELLKLDAEDADVVFVSEALKGARPMIVRTVEMQLASGRKIVVLTDKAKS